MEERLNAYKQHLEERELSKSTIRTYMSCTKDFIKYLGRHKITKKVVMDYKNALLQKYKIATVNLYIIAVNQFLCFVGEEGCTVKTGKRQRRQSIDNVITEQDYKILLEYASETGREKYYLIMKTLAMTGIRVSELRYITVDTLARGYTQVNNKGKIREIYLPDNLIRQIYTYCNKEKITKGVIFRGNKDAPISRTAVWQMLKHMADMVGINKEKVYPHSFRHFFALSYMNRFSNIFELADILGHSSLETTRIYTTASIEQKRKRMGELEERS